jgi:carboxyl-terminal processing protease
MLAARNTERVNMLRKHLLRPLIASAVIFMPLSGIAEETAVEITEDQSAIESSPQIQQELPLQDLRTFTEIFERIRSSYVEEVDDKTLFNNAIKGMLNSLDPHSAYLQEEDFSDLQENTSGKFGGLGIEVGMENGLVRVITPIDDTPAQRAGIRAGDLIVSLDGEPVMGLSLSDAVELMRGQPGTPITLEVRRKGEADLLSFKIERAEIKVASVRTDMLDGEIGYVRLTQFQENTGTELQEALRAWQNDTDLNGVILDMRNNPGGVLQAAVVVVDTFISEGLIVYTEGRSPMSDVRYEARAETLMPDVPIVVLINGGSASASEIVAGALQDHSRAVIVGTQSFGKGSVQTVLPVSETAAVKLTTARYFTPDGRSIQAQGIVPDIVVEQSEVTPSEQQYYKESDLPGHLENPDGKVTSKNGSESKEENKSDDLIRRDFQLYEAHTLLRGVTILSPKKTKSSATAE